jgi:hypothetical protein
VGFDTTPLPSPALRDLAAFGQLVEAAKDALAA